MDIMDYQRPRRPKPRQISLFGDITLSDKTKKILWIAILIIGIPALIIMGLQWKIQSEKSKMNVPESKRINQYIYMIKDDFVQMVLLKDSTNNYLAIDAGNDISTIRNELKKMNVDTSKVTAIFLTHSDGDHQGALALFPQADVYLGADEEQMINGKTARFLFKHNKLNRKKHYLMNDNQVIQAGAMHVKAIFTPGHTPGSTSYLVNDTLLFTGDAFGLTKDKRIARPNTFFTMDMDKAITSFHKINQIPTARYLFTSHNGFSIDYRNAVKDGLQ